LRAGFLARKNGRVHVTTTRRSKTTHERRTLELRPDGALRLVTVADTHSRPDPRAGSLIAAERPDRILHAGDIGDRAVLDALAAHAPVIAVRGNIDARMPGVPDTLTIDVEEGGRTLLRILLLHVALNGTKLRADAVRLARAEDASLIVCGHSHVPFLGRDQGIAVVNAGSIGPRRFHLPIVFAVVDVRRDGVSIHHVSCETGERWVPGAR
jgi:putative phosphoesterase